MRCLACGEGGAKPGHFCPRCEGDFAGWVAAGMPMVHMKIYPEAEVNDVDVTPWQFEQLRRLADQRDLRTLTETEYAAACMLVCDKLKRWHVNRLKVINGPTPA